MKKQIIIALAFAASAAFGWEAALPLVTKVTGGSGGAVDESPVHPGYAANADTSLFVRVYSPDGVNPYGLAADVQKTREFVYRMAALGSSRYITSTSVPGEPFPTYAAMMNAVATHTAANPKLFYNGAAVEPTKDDWCVILADETHPNATTGEPQTTRWGFVGEFGAGGQFQFQIVLSGTSFTTEQMAAIDSTVTKDDVDWGRLMRTNGLAAALAEKRDKDDLATYGRFDVPASWRSDETNGSVRAYPYTGTSGTPGTSGYRYNWGMTDARARQVSYYPNRGLLNVTVAGIGNTNLTVAAGKDPMSDDPVASDLGGPYKVAENMGGLFTFIAKRKGVVLPDGGRLATVSNLVEVVEWAARDATNYVDAATNAVYAYVHDVESNAVTRTEVTNVSFAVAAPMTNALWVAVTNADEMLVQAVMLYVDVATNGAVIAANAYTDAATNGLCVALGTVITNAVIAASNYTDRAVARKRDLADNRCYASEGGALAKKWTPDTPPPAGITFTKYQPWYDGINRYFYWHDDRGESAEYQWESEPDVSGDETYLRFTDTAEGMYGFYAILKTVQEGTSVCVSNELFVTPSFVTNAVNAIATAPGNYAAVSNAAMTAHRDATNYTDAAVAGIEKSGTDQQIVRGEWFEGVWYIEVERAQSAGSAGSADTATQATNDGYGNNIVETYARKDEIPPQPGNYAAVSNAAMTAHQDATNLVTLATNGLLRVETDPVWSAEKSGYQERIDDLTTIREGAALGATALQEHQSLAPATNYTDIATNGLVRADITNGLASVEYVDSATNGLARAADIPTAVSELTNDVGYVTEAVTNGLVGVETDPTVGLTNATVYASGTNMTFLTEHQSLAPATNYTDEAVAGIERSGTDQQIVRGEWFEDVWYINVERAQSAGSAGSADTATQATNDGYGNNIVETYARKDEIPPPPGNYTAVSNAAMTAHQDATNYTDSAVNALIDRIAAAAASLDPSRSSVSNIIMVLKALGQ